MLPRASRRPTRRAAPRRRACVRVGAVTMSTLAATISLLLFEHVAAARRPNILFCLVDDWGYNDVGFHNVRGACKPLPVPFTVSPRQPLPNR